MLKFSRFALLSALLAVATGAQAADEKAVALVNGAAIPQARMDMRLKAATQQGQPDSPELQKAIDFVKKYPDSKFSVEGYTDDRGSDEYNLKLSERRAQAVKKYLEDNGHVKAARITAVVFASMEHLSQRESER